MNLYKLQTIYDISKVIITQAESFEKTFKQFQPLNFFMDGQTLIGTTYIEMEIQISKIERKTTKIQFMLIVRFSRRLHFSIATETPLPQNHPIIMSNGLLKQGELWSFTTFDNLYHELEMIFQINETFDRQFQEAKKLLDEYMNKRIHTNVFKQKIQQYKIDFRLLKLYIENKQQSIENSQFEKHLNQIERVFVHMIENNEMNEEEKQLFEERIKALYYDIL